MEAWQEKQIEEILENFDFEKVYRVMKMLNWGWGTKGVPTLTQVILHARKRLADLIEQNETYSDSGGFLVEKHKCGTLSLRFVVEDWEAFPPEDKEVAIEEGEGSA